MNLRSFEDRRGTKALFWFLALFALVMALIPHPPELPGNPSDKLQHVAAFGTLAFVGRLAYPRLSDLRLIVALSLFGAFIEIAQAIPVLHRDCDPLDWLADTIACSLVVIALRWWRATNH